MSEQAQGARNPEKSGAPHEVIEIIKTLATALLIALVLKTVFFQPFTIPSASMEPNLYQGDYIVVSKYAYGWSRHSIVFSPPLFQALSAQTCAGAARVLWPAPWPNPITRFAGSIPLLR